MWDFTTDRCTLGLHNYRNLGAKTNIQAERRYRRAISDMNLTLLRKRLVRGRRHEINLHTNLRDFQYSGSVCKFSERAVRHGCVLYNNGVSYYFIRILTLATHFPRNYFY